MNVAPSGPSGTNKYAREVAFGIDYAYSTIQVYDYPPVPWRFQVCDVSVPTSPVVISRSTLGPDPADVMVRHQHLLMATEDGLKIFDLSVAGAPAELGWLPLANGADRLDALATWSSPLSQRTITGC